MKTRSFFMALSASAVILVGLMIGGSPVHGSALSAPSRVDPVASLTTSALIEQCFTTAVVNRVTMAIDVLCQNECLAGCTTFTTMTEFGEGVSCKCSTGSPDACCHLVVGHTEEGNAFGVGDGACGPPNCSPGGCTVTAEYKGDDIWGLSADCE